MEIAWEEAEVSLDLLLRALQQVREVVGRLADAGVEEVEDSLGSLSSIATSLEEIGCKITALVMEPEPDQIYWVEQDPLQNRLSFNDCPAAHWEPDAKIPLA